MSDIKNMEELQGYRRKIYDGTKRNLHEGIANLNQTLDMLDDFQEICVALFDLVNEQKREIDIITNQNEKLKAEIDNKTEGIEKLEEKAAEYEELEMSAVKAVSLLHLMEEKSNQLEEEQEKFEVEKEKFKQEKEAFHTVKVQLEEDKKETEDRAEKLKEERNSALVSRDEAIAEKRKIEKEMKNMVSEIERLKGNIEEYDQKLIDAENCVQEYKEQLRRSEDSKEWYKKYAEALDQKIIDKYEKTNKEALRAHYENYLNNPLKLEEHREHFPNFKREEENKKESTKEKDVKGNTNRSTVQKEDDEIVQDK